MTISEWIREATRPILLKNDRKQAAQELADHFEDHCSALTARGKSPEQAEQDALAAMGDAKETGLLLRQAYQPVLSVLWRISKWILVLACLVLAFLVIREGPDLWEKYDSGYWEKQMTEGYEWGGPVCYTNSDAVKADPFTIQITKNITRRSYDGEETVCFLLLLEASGPFWLPGPENLLSYIEATDSQKNHYENNTDKNLPYSKAPRLTGKYLGCTFGRWYYEIDLNKTGKYGHLPEWIELRFNHGNASFTLRLSLEEEWP